jgi:hypothetical protein
MVIAEPALHGPDLVALRHGDTGAEHLHLASGTMARRPAGHRYCLRMMADHALHELHISRCIVGFLRPERARQEATNYLRTSYCHNVNDNVARLQPQR